MMQGYDSCIRYDMYLIHWYINFKNNRIQYVKYVYLKVHNNFLNMVNIWLLLSELSLKLCILKLLHKKW